MGKGIPVLGDRAAREAFAYGSLHTDEVTLGTWKHHVPEPSADTVLTADATGQPEWVSELPVALGGTGLNAVAIGDIIYASAASVLAALAGNATTTKKFLTQTGDGVTPGAPAWGAVSASDVLGSIAQGDLLYGSATDTIAALAKNTSATRYLSNTGASNNPAWAQINLANGVTGTLLETNGGTGMSSYIAGDLLYAANATTLAQLGIGASGTIISSNGSLPTWSTLASLGIVTGALTSGRVAYATGATTIGGGAGFLTDGSYVAIGSAAAVNTNIPLDISNSVTDPAATQQGYRAIETIVITANSAVVHRGNTARLTLQLDGFNLTGNAQIGMFGSLTLKSTGGGTLSNGIAIQAERAHTAINQGTTWTNAVGLTIPAISNMTGNTVTNDIGAFIVSTNNGTNNVKILVNPANTYPTGNWFIYSSSTDDSYIAGNILQGLTAGGASATNTWAQANGTAPTSSPTNAYQLYSKDRWGTGGKAHPHVRTEDTTILALIGETSADVVQLTDYTVTVAGSTILPNAPYMQGVSAAATSATSGTMTTTMTNAAQTVFTITPSGDCTFNASGGVAGAHMTFYVTTSGTTSRTLTFGTNFKSQGTLATGVTSGVVFTVSFVCKNGTEWAETGRTIAM